MHIWIQLILREAEFLALLLCLGSGPVVFLSERFDTAARIALAPLFGFAVATCLLTNLLQLFPAADTEWVLVPMAVISLAIAVSRVPAWQPAAACRVAPRPREVAQLAVVTLAVCGPLNYT